MKKFLLLLFVLLLFGATAPAQITIANTDMPVSGDTLRMSIGLAFTGMDATLTGPNHTWDYSQLTSVSQTIDTFLNVSSTAPVYALYFANLGLNKNRSNLAQRGTAFAPVPGLSISDVFNFYYNSVNRFEQTGFGAAINGVTIPTPYAPHDTIYHFPLNYGNVDSSYAGYAVNLPGLFYFRAHTFRHNEADGWGSLTTPYGTFDVLRVKTTITGQDSVYLDTLGFGLSFPVPTQVQYKWLAKGKDEPVLQINTTSGIVTQIIYRDSVRAPYNIGVMNREALTAGPVVFPNPSGNVQSIIYSLQEAADVLLEVYDIAGNKITTLADERQAPNKHIYTLDVRDQKFSSGTYLLKLAVNGKSYLQKLLVTK